MKKLLLTTLVLAATAATARDNWVNSTGTPWKNSTGQCWRNGSWTPATAHPDCDGALKTPPRVHVVLPAAPVVVEAPKPPVEQPKPNVEAVKITYATDTLFDFDKSVLKPEGRDMLNGLIGKINHDFNDGAIVIAVGHTDWVGTDEYNQKLGLRRAAAVKAFLVSKGMDPKMVYIDSKGEKQPIADNRTAQGRAKNRRVEIEVVGTRR
jgi:OOP family OmpA-OmpF porin